MNTGIEETSDTNSSNNASAIALCEKNVDQLSLQNKPVRGRQTSSFGERIESGWIVDISIDDNDEISEKTEKGGQFKENEQKGTGNSTPSSVLLFSKASLQNEGRIFFLDYIDEFRRIEVLFAPS